MLPLFKKTIPTAIVTAALLVGATAPAQAWDREDRAFLKGVVAALVVDAIIDDAKKKKKKADPVPQPQPVVVTNIYATPAAQAYNAYSPAQRRLIQQRLAAYGYYRSSIDGSFGPGTYNAIAVYARDMGQSSALSSQAGAFGLYDQLIYG